MSQFAKDNSVFFEFHASFFFFFINDCHTKTILHQGPLRVGLYQLNPSQASPQINQALVGERTSTNHWHRHLGYPAFQVIKHVLSKFSLPTTSNKSGSPCFACCQAKGHQLSFQHLHLSSSPLDLIYSDLWSPVFSIHGNHYYVSFIDAFSKYTWLFPIHCKSHVYAIFLQFQSMVKRLFNLKIKCIQLIGVGNFDLSPFLKRLELFICVSCPHTHQQ
jgi:hypothetical protein